jgi:hypothetical protein
MLIREILELLETENIASVSKTRLSIGEKKTRDTLRAIGCIPNKGQKGWTYEGDNPEVLKKSIYDLAPPRKSRTIRPTANSVQNNASKNTSKSNNKRARISSSNSQGGNDIKTEIQSLMQGKDTNKADKLYRGIYFDRDVAHFLDNVPHGNKSEIVNKILRQFLIENELL